MSGYKRRVGSDVDNPSAESIMSRLNLLAAAAALGILVAAPAAFAQSTSTPGIDQRVVNQQERIANGVASGQLTGREANRLEHGEQRILKAEQAAKADGTVTKKERRRLQRMENKESARIYQQKHDAQQR
jgi:hypothetical protein